MVDTINTIKFSQFSSGGDLSNGATTVGLASGSNAQFNNPWTFLPSGTTSQRPAPSSVINYRLRFNTDDQLYEYYDAVAGMWTQLQENSFLTGPYITYTADSNLPNAQNLSLLTNGLLKQTIASDIATLAIATNGTDYYGPGFTGYISAPAGLKDVNGNIMLGTSVNISAVNYVNVFNGATGIAPGVEALGTDTNIDFKIQARGTGQVFLATQNTTFPVIIFSGTGFQHNTSFAIANTPASRTITIPDATGTMLMTGQAINTVPSISFGGSPLSTYITGGTFTPTITFGGASVGMTFSSQLGTYSRIGNIVTFHIFCQFTAVGSSTGNASIVLPFSPAQANICFAVYGQFFTSTTPPWIQQSSGVNFMFQGFNSGGSGSVLTNSAFANGTQLVISGSYLV